MVLKINLENKGGYIVKVVDVGVLGGGSWGTALAMVLSNKGHNVTMWSRNKEQVDDMIKLGENKKYLPNVRLPKNLKVTNNIKEAIINKDIILLSVPTHSVRDVLVSNKEYIKEDQVIVNVAKGIENDTLLRVSEIVSEILPKNKFVVLSGPSHAEEVALNIPTTVVSASSCQETAEFIQDVFITSEFRVYTNPDVIGVELGGALKNIIAFGAGMSDGLNYGDNTKSALMTRGLFEIARLGTALGAEESTFFGLTGVGDLIVTCTSMHSRNRRAGILVGKGYSLDEAVEEIGMVVEGIKTTKSAYNLAKKYNIDMPITSEIYNVLYNNSNVNESVLNLMKRPRKHEMENILNNDQLKW